MWLLFLSEEETGFLRNHRQYRWSVLRLPLNPQEPDLQKNGFSIFSRLLVAWRLLTPSHNFQACKMQDPDHRHGGIWRYWEHNAYVSKKTDVVIRAAKLSALFATYDFQNQYSEADFVQNIPSITHSGDMYPPRCIFRWILLELIITSDGGRVNPCPIMKKIFWTY